MRTYRNKVAGTVVTVPGKLHNPDFEEVVPVSVAKQAPVEEMPKPVKRKTAKKAVK